MKIKKIIALIFVLFCFVSVFQGYEVVGADELCDNVHEQLEHIDLSELEKYFNELEDIPANVDFFDSVVKMLNGEFDLNFNSMGEYVLNVFLKNIYRFIPTFISIIAIAIFCGIIKNIKSNFLSDGVGEIILFVCLMSIILLLASEIVVIYQNTKNVAKS